VDERARFFEYRPIQPGWLASITSRPVAVNIAQPLATRPSCTCWQIHQQERNHENANRFFTWNHLIPSAI